MSQPSVPPSSAIPEQPTHLDYGLTGVNSTRAIERGLAEATWYRSPVPREQLRQLMERRDGPAMRDTALWLGLLCATAYASIVLSGSWWVIPPYLIYAVLYATASDSRWHEASHGTAFKTDWMNNALYEVASFMVMRESVIWRWSHNRHHSDTVIVGRDPEIQVPRPPNMRAHIASVFNIGNYQTYFVGSLGHARGRMTAAEQTFVPASEFSKVYRNARWVLALNAGVVVFAALVQSWAPIFLILLPHFFGTWLMIVHNTTQHAGLAENVLDHRLNCRTVFMNPFSRFIYWNMNYHLEHHMYPLVPYHALPRMHELIKADCPPPYPSIAGAWRELLPAVLRQVKEPGYCVQRPLPAPTQQVEEATPVSHAEPDADGWVAVGPSHHLRSADAIRFDHRKNTFALVRADDGRLFGIDGMCTHGNTHLADGLVKDGIIECPKHNGRFHLADGSAARAPICRGLSTYPLEERSGCLYLNVARKGGAAAGPAPKTLALRVVSNRSVATFIKELVLQPLDPATPIAFKPGDYLQLDVPAYDAICFEDFDIPEPYAQVWHAQNAFAHVVRNAEHGRRNNYSLASNPAHENLMRFNVRIAMPPAGQDVPPGAGSSYAFSLQAGDTVTALGPFGDFHIKPTQREMVYIGGGAGMAPLRAHVSYLFETEHTARKVSFWYGARNRQEVFYDDYFQAMAQSHANFSFHLALSSPMQDEGWTGHVGLIHEVVLAQYLRDHPNPKAIEFYLCGPPQMMQACHRMLADLGIPANQIAFDEF
jgi:Na+-transporting NADH:ubiquinone oxidoreductase subunit F